MRELTLLVCVLLRRVCGEDEAQDLVVGLLSQRVTLPCSVTIPDNWRHDDIHITWYKNFTEKLLDCIVRNDKIPVCEDHPDSPRIRLSWKFGGNADIDIDNLQESDGGSYQCWIIFQDAYQRSDSLLRVQAGAPGAKTDSYPLQKHADWQIMAVVSTLNVLLISGWPFAVFLAGILLSQRYCHRRQKIFIVI